MRKRRETCAWTQRQLADRIGVERVYITQIEGGTRGVSLEVLAKLARAFRCSMGELLGERPRARLRARRNSLRAR